MPKTIPIIDKRTSSDIALQIQKLLKEKYTPEWNGGFNPATGEPKGLSTALINIFARFTEIIIHRLNKVPEKNFLAFLDLLGASLMPPQPSHVPLTFTLAKGATVDAIVPKGTRVAALPDEGEKEPVIFETNRELVATSTQLASVYFKDPSRDMYSDKSRIKEPSDGPGLSIFLADAIIEHILYVGSSSLLAYSNPDALSLIFGLENGDSNGGMELSWEFWNGSSWEEKIPAKDETKNFGRSGTVSFEKMRSVPPMSVDGSVNRWLRCRLKTQITPDVQLPMINDLTLSAEIEREGLDIDSGFSNTQPLDPTKEFYPFGERPRYGDVFYISSNKAFSNSGSHIKIHVELVNPSSSDTDDGIPPVNEKGNPKLRWELWNGKRWVELKVSDATRSFTRSGVIEFTLETEPVIIDVNGAENYWIRARLIGGNYGRDARYELKSADRPDGGYTLIPETFAPPLIKTATVDYKLSRTENPEVLMTHNNFEYEKIMPPTEGGADSFLPFKPADDKNPTLYLRFTLPLNRTDFPNRKISLYAEIVQKIYGTNDMSGSTAGIPGAIWEYWDGEGWVKTIVNDDTGIFSRSGLIEFFAAGDFSPKVEFGVNGYWLRLRFHETPPNADSMIKSILMNTIPATQALTVRDETLGSSDASENQVFYTTRTPVISGQSLHVREPEIPSVHDISASAKEHDESLSIVTDNTGRPSEIWILWSEVSDFYGSRPHDRHYVLDHISGEIRFGDGQNGMSPPAGAGNIRMTEYRSGGGRRGNKPAGSIVELKTSVPYIDKVVNPVPASGGADPESMDSLLERAPREIRHRGRAVTIEDYEDLAVKASTEVARAMCVPVRNLKKDPLAKPVRYYTQDEAGEAGGTGESGEVSVIIVPESKDYKPRPSIELIDRVQSFLEINSIPTVSISVVGPIFVSVNVTAEIALATMEGASLVEQRIYNVIEKYLHPLTGGSDGKGWKFGREPHRSDFYGLIEAVPGVDHINYLTVEDREDHPGIKDTGRFLVYSGNHKISLVFE